MADLGDDQKSGLRDLFQKLGRSATAGAGARDEAKFRLAAAEARGFLGQIEQLLGEAPAPSGVSVPSAQPEGALGREERGEDRRMELSDFFREVGQGVVAAQQALDRQSLSYLQSAPDHALPAVFRLPKVSAEFQFAVDESQQRGFSIIVASGSRTRRESMQQKIAFEIVSAPPPPELLDRGQGDRAIIERRLLKVRDDPETLNENEKAFAEELLRNLSQAVIARGAQSWFVLWGKAADELWLAEVPYDPDADAKPFPHKTVPDGARYQRLAGWLNEYAEAMRRREQA